jgi:hypothetical protein
MPFASGSNSLLKSSRYTLLCEVLLDHVNEIFDATNRPFRIDATFLCKGPYFSVRLVAIFFAPSEIENFKLPR